MDLDILVKEFQVFCIQWKIEEGQVFLVILGDMELWSRLIAL